jgi:hypothetical protein
MSRYETTHPPKGDQLVRFMEIAEIEAGREPNRERATELRRVSTDFSDVYVREMHEKVGGMKLSVPLWNLHAFTTGLQAMLATAKQTGNFEEMRTFHTALRNSGVKCRWHDLRHTTASRFGEGGVPEQTLLALGGWMRRKMLERYSHTRIEAKRLAIDALDGISDGVGTKLGTVQ